MEEFDDKIKRMAENANESNHSTMTGEDREYQQIFDTAKNWKVPENKSNEDSWSQLEQILGQQETELEKTHLKKSNLYAIAASVSVIIISALVYYFFIFGHTVVSTKISQIATVFLPDSTKVTLNAVSSIVYNKDNFNTNRELTLDGQAFFEVKKGSSFVVNTGDISTQVLGTSFSIYAREDKVEVNCVSGKVKVLDKVKEHVLIKGEGIEAQNGILESSKDTFEPETAISWTDGKFYYHGESLNLVVKEIENQFGVKIKGADFGKRYYTGYFDNQKLQSALKQVLTPMGYSYEIQGSVITVR